MTSNATERSADSRERSDLDWASVDTGTGPYQGWPSWECWNVATWIGNDYVLYSVARGFSGYRDPYKQMRKELRDSVGFTRTKDGVSLWELTPADIAALDELINES